MAVNIAMDVIERVFTQPGGNTLAYFPIRKMIRYELSR
jgi:hypothetical protein